MVHCYGGESVARSIDEMLDATERRIRGFIRDHLRDGTYTSSDWLDEDGIHDEPVKLAVTITVQRDTVKFDFSDCAAQLSTGKNIP
jgi:N-methylhydantoinase B